MKRLLFPMVSLILFVATLSLNLTASTETILHSFSPETHGLSPTCIISDGAGNFYVCAGGGTYGFGVIAKFSPNSQGTLTETVLYNFADTPDGARPIALLLDGSGNLWGLTESGGANEAGTFFELTPTAHGQWNESALYSFPSTANGYLSGGLVEDKSGNFYGTTENCCGSTSYGSVFQLTNSGGVWTQNVMHIFTNGTDGGRPYGRLTLDPAGNVYGTTFEGGVGDNGLVFEFVPASGGTWTENVLYDFVGGSDGSSPGSGVTFDQSGNLYGTTTNGGGGCRTVGCGTVYELIPGTNGHWTEKILDAFVNQGISGSPQDLIFDSAGDIYGSSNNGGRGYGWIFELSPGTGGSWTETTLWTFKERGDGGSPTDVLLGPQGQLYGATYLGGNSGLDGSVFELQLNSGKWNLSTLYGFPPSDGAWPYASLIFDGSGNLYGTTSYGGLQNLGAVFEVSPGESWKESLIYSFPGIYNYQPVYPSGLASDSAGHLYGAAGFNGSSNEATGSLFELTQGTGVGWQEETLLNFHGAYYSPAPGPTVDASGHVFQTVPEGDGGHGAVVELTRQPDGKYTDTTIYSFAGYPNDGAHPGAALIMDAAGKLYGTTQTGGSSSECTSGGQPVGCGTVFELQPVAGGGWKEIVLLSFVGYPTDGATPSAPLVFDSAGNLYGTTLSGGKAEGCKTNQGVSGCGTVFELSPAAGGLWNETILHDFSRNNGDGIGPQAGVIFDSLGNLYGTTATGGAFTRGTVYELLPNSGGGWTETILHSFGNGTDGQLPSSGLVRDALGNLYGTTYSGGSASFGTVFKITP